MDRQLTLPDVNKSINKLYFWSCDWLDYETFAISAYFSILQRKRHLERFCQWRSRPNQNIFRRYWKITEFWWSIDFSDLDDLDKYMLELHRKDRQFTDLVPEPDAANDQERIFVSIVDIEYRHVIIWNKRFDTLWKADKFLLLSESIQGMRDGSFGPLNTGRNDIRIITSAIRHYSRGIWFLERGKKYIKAWFYYCCSIVFLLS